MPRDHIIPKFILRGFSINPTANKQNQKIMVLDVATGDIKTEKIDDAFAIRDFNSDKTEKLLANEYENKIARIFQRINKCAENNDTNVTLTNEEYKLLFRFFIIMWRRNEIHKDGLISTGKTVLSLIQNDFAHILNTDLLPEYKDVNLAEQFEKESDNVSKSFYDNIIRNTTDNDPTVLKTILNYYPTIVHNKTNTNFTLHNSYGTILYAVNKEGKVNDGDEGKMIIEPISKNLCFCLYLSDEQIEQDKAEYSIPIDIFDDEKLIKGIFIDRYMTSTATSYVINDSNINIIKSNLEKKYE